MGSDAKKAYGAEGRGDTLKFLPESLVIIKDPNHFLFDERALWPFDEALVQVILSQGGIDDPILIVKDGEINGRPNVLVVDGRQRVTAYIEANKRLIAMGQKPLVIEALPQKGDEGHLIGVMISSNENRRGDNLMVKAKKAARLLKANRSIKQVGVVFGVSPVTIGNWLKLLDCSGEVQKKVENGTLSASAAIEVSTLPREEQGKALEALQKATPEGQKENPSAATIKKAKDGKTGRVSGRVRSRKEVSKLRETIDATPLQYRPTPVEVLDWALGNTVEAVSLLLAKG